nr:MAG TPA: hypothetical protein [Caudoviricetes sp.]
MTGRFLGKTKYTMSYKFMRYTPITYKFYSNSLFMIFCRFTEILKIIKPIIFI